MTFVEYAESISLNPLSHWQIRLLEKYEYAKANNLKLNVCYGRINGITETKRMIDEINQKLENESELFSATYRNSPIDFAMKHFCGVGSTKGLEKYGIYLRSNNWNKIHHLPKRRRCK